MPKPAILAVIIASALVVRASEAQQASWPAARSRHHLIYDPLQRQMLLLGGAADTAMWIWTGTTWQRSSRTVPPRANEAVAFDARRRRIVMHGGSDRPDETFEFDGRQWHSVAASGPGKRGHHSLIFDPVRNHMLLFGNNDDTPTTDTWAWDGRSWMKIADTGPPARGVMAATFDPRREVVVVFGGCCARGFLGDTWEWDGRRWTQIATPTSPSPRYDARIVYDPARKRVVLFGGQGPNGAFGDTWEYDGRSWTKLDVAGPSPRSAHAMVYDPRGKAILLFGGRQGRTALDDFWSFDGVWRRIPEP